MSMGTDEDMAFRPLSLSILNAVWSDYTFGPTPDTEAADEIERVIELHRSPSLVDPLHARARAAITALGLDGSRLEMAVSVFGWGSDEANGSLLGLVRAAWDEPHCATQFDDGHWEVWVEGGGTLGIGETETEALAAALEAKAFPIILTAAEIAAD